MPKRQATGHRRSIRLAGYDYTRPGGYFVTVCALRKRPPFGRVRAAAVRLNAFGRVVGDEWERTPRRRPAVSRGPYVIMPNHMHGVLFLDGGDQGTARRAPTRHHRSPEPDEARRRFGYPDADSLPSIIRAFKAAATRRINGLRRTPAAPVWQRGFYEHVIRNEEDFARISDYIAANPGRDENTVPYPWA